MNDDVNITLYHDHDVGVAIDGKEYVTKEKAVSVPQSIVDHLCDTFGFRRTKDKPKVDAPAQQSELEALKARIAELEAKKK